MMKNEKDAMKVEQGIMKMKERRIKKGKIIKNGMKNKKIKK